MRSAFRFIATLGIVLILSSVAQAAVLPQEYERITKELSQMLKLYRHLVQLGEADEPALARRDPLRALIDSEGKPVNAPGLYEGIYLRGIVRSEGFNRALVDDKLYAEGDSVGSYSIQEIRDDGITVAQGNSVLFIPLYPAQKAEKGAL